jgi:DNA-binding beta-propeller fold protein YncE
MITTLLLALAPCSTDDLLLCAFGSNSVTRHDARAGTVEGSFGPSPLTGTLGAAIGPDGHLYVCSETNDRVLRFDAASGALLDTFIVDDPNTVPDETGGLDGPSAIVFRGDGLAYVASFNTDAVLTYDERSGAFVGVFVAPSLGGLNGPDAGMAFGPDGHLYVPSYFSHHIKFYDGASGLYLGDFMSNADGLRNPRGIIFHSDGSVYVTSEGNKRVFRCDLAGGATCQALVVDDINTVPDETGGLNRPTGIGFGPDDNLAVASLNSDQVLRYRRSDGAFLGVHVAAGAGGNHLPTHLLFRPDVAKYCVGAPNSAGAGAALSAEGWTSLQLDALTLTASWAVPNQMALFFYGSSSTQLTFGDGFRCVAGALRRLPVFQLDAAGGGRQPLNLSQPTSPIRAGATWYFQLWYRDPAGAGSGFNASDGLSVNFRS